MNIEELKTKINDLLEGSEVKASVLNLLAEYAEGLAKTDKDDGPSGASGAGPSGASGIE